MFCIKDLVASYKNKNLAKLLNKQIYNNFYT